MDTDRFEDDAALIRSCVERDLSAWDLFVKKYSGHILTSIGCRLRKYGIYLKAEDLKEVQQDTLTLLWEGGKLAEIRNPASLKYWLAIISGNTAVQYMRRQKRLDRLAAKSLSETIGGTEMADMLPSSVLTPAQELERSELSEKIEKALESLPDKEKLALKLSLLYGKKYEEISGIMAMPPGTVSSYIKRAKKRLRKKLQQFSGF
jgi:RNA polymerase sigma-70 factor (ECF subfamily)